MTFNYAKAIDDFTHKVYHEHNLCGDDFYESDDESLMDAISNLESWQSDAEVAEFELGMYRTSNWKMNYPIHLPDSSYPNCVLHNDEECLAHLHRVIVDSAAKIEAYLPEAEKILATFVAKHKAA